MKKYEYTSGIIDDLYKYYPDEITTTEQKEYFKSLVEKGWKLVGVVLFKDRYTVGYFERELL